MQFSKLALFFALLIVGTASLQAQTTFNRIEEMDRWHMCSACANSGGGATTSMTQHMTSPSLDGNSSRFTVGGTTPNSHALYYRWMSNNSTATNFVYEVNQYMKNPSASTGMEYSVSQRRGYYWFRWDTQCSFYFNTWRLWDNANAKWVNIGVPCKRPAANTWTRIRFEGKRSNGKVVFVAITVNGQRHYINRSFYPKKMTSSNNAVNIHFQLNGDRNQTDYVVYGDKFYLKYW